MVSWSAIQSLLVFFGPLIYRKVRTSYASMRTSLPPVPLPPKSRRLLDFLFLCAAFSLLLTTPWLTPENIFTRTNSRLQTPTDVLFTRLSRQRALTPEDNALRSRLMSKDGRLLYTAYGPQPLIECNWCSLNEPQTFLWYALPGILWPHLLHLFVLGVATSTYFSHFGAVWRTQATLAGVGLFAAELWVTGISGNGLRANAVARTEGDIVWTYWKMRMFRGAGMAAVDTILGYVIYLSATRRWSIGWEGQVMEARLEGSFKCMERAASFLHAGNYLKQTVLRDADLRGEYVDWWTKEDRVGRELMEDDEVRTVRTESLPTRKNLDLIRSEAEKKSEGLMSIMMGMMQDGTEMRQHQE